MLKKHWVFLLALAVFLALLARNPFSARTLIPNFEPYPDAIHYVNPALSLAKGQGLQLTYEGRKLQTNVPPLYSLVLTPFFLIKADARMFYFTNVIIALLSFFLFYLSTRKITKNRLILFTALFLYATNYFIYWFPSLAMAENLTLLLFTAGLYLLTLPVTIPAVVSAGFLAVLFYMTKYASLPLTGIYGLAYLAKIITAPGKGKGKYSAILVLTAAVSFAGFSAWEYTVKGSTLLISLLASLLHISNGGTSSAPSGAWFSLSYIPATLPKYLRTLLGGYGIRFLWDNTPIVPVIVGIPGLTGLFMALADKKQRLLAGSLIAMLAGSILFMSTFYSVDMRYLYHAIPTLLIGFVMFWQKILDNKNILKNGNLKIGLYAVFAVLFLYYGAFNAVRIKSQISINLRYAETPWYYLSIENLNKYFTKKSSPVPYVITAQSPYYVSFFSNGNYELLPMSASQDFFRSGAETVWGKDNYGSLPALYENKLSKGYSVFLLNYLGNDENIRKDLDRIKELFNLIPVSEGCFGSCTIYRLQDK